MPSGALLTLFALTLWVGLTIAWAKHDTSHRLITSYRTDLRLFRSNWKKLALVLTVLLYVSAPIGFSWLGYKGIHLPSKLIPGFPLSEFALAVFNFGGIFAIGTLALNLLTGYAGQVSLGHSTFIGVGAYAAGYFGSATDAGGLGLPLPIWLLLAAAAGAIISAIVGPFALRLRGDYLAVITVGLLVTAEHLFNSWTDVTGGPVGRGELPAPSVSLWPGQKLVFSGGEDGSADFFGFGYTRNSAFFWLIWAVVALAVLVAFNLVRSRHGRAMMAVRDRDLSAEAIGVELSETKIRAFAVCGALAGLSGALYGSYLQFVQPESFGLNLSIQYVAMMIVGGAGTISGSLIGALVIGGLDRVIDRYKWVFGWGPVKHLLFFISTGQSDAGMKLPNFVRTLFGLLIVVFLVFFPNGLAALWDRTRRYFSRWPLAR
jgi:branched-chain amino acid transport system permease protein